MRVLKWVVRIVGTLVVLVLVAAGVVIAMGYGTANGKVKRRIPEVAIVADSAHVERGRHIAEVICSGCHSPEGSLPLAGGSENYFLIPHGPNFGVLVAPNLTPGGVLRQYSDGALLRAIREGIGFDDRPLLVMPARMYQGMSDEDAHSVIAFLRSQPAVDHVVPARAPNLMAYCVQGLRMFPSSVQSAIDGPIAEVPADSTAEYVRYMTPLFGCADCHGAGLRGGTKGQFPPIGPDLVSIVAAHSLPEFELALRHGVSARDGHALDPMQMPFAHYSKLTDLEVVAVYRHIKELSAP
jgi:mono/diheme cytochrome c family protein